MAQNLNYTKCGDYLIPDIKLKHTSEQPLGKYGRMCRAFAQCNNTDIKNNDYSDTDLILSFPERSGGECFLFCTIWFKHY